MWRIVVHGCLTKRLVGPWTFSVHLSQELCHCSVREEDGVSMAVLLEVQNVFVSLC